MVEVAHDALGCAFVRVADAAATRREHNEPIAGRDFLKSLAAHRVPRLEPDVTGRAVAAAVAPARRMLDAVESRQKLKGRGNAVLDLDHLAMTAAGAAGS